LIRPIIL